jgi:selT/selW/selH-like putative selenoprotein
MLRRSSGGVFEITVDGALRFSKKREHRFPTEEEVARAIA